MPKTRLKRKPVENTNLPSITDESPLSDTIKQIKELEKEARGGSTKAFRARQKLYDIGMTENNYKALEAFLRIPMKEKTGEQFTITADDLVRYDRAAQLKVEELESKGEFQELGGSLSV